MLTLAMGRCARPSMEMASLPVLPTFTCVAAAKAATAAAAEQRRQSSGGGGGAERAERAGELATTCARVASGDARRSAEAAVEGGDRAWEEAARPIW